MPSDVLLMPNATTPHSRCLRAETAKNRNNRLAAEGCSRFSVLLNANETAALAAIQAKTGESKAGVVKRLILAAAAAQAAAQYETANAIRAMRQRY